jgi:hypothetical protein
VSYDGNEEIWFRFNGISEQQVLALQKAGSPLEVRPKKKSPSQFVVSLRLQDGRDYGWLGQVIADQGIPESKFGLFVSLVTKHDSEIVTLPPFALALSRRVGGLIEFSSTVGGDE